jgi:hypothetical protein
MPWQMFMALPRAGLRRLALTKRVKAPDAAGISAIEAACATNAARTGLAACRRSR